LDDLFSRMRRHLSVSRAFGEAYHADGATIIPVALVAGGGGGGEGSSSPGDDDDDDDEDDEDAEPGEVSSGFGGGFGGVVVPVGVYVVRDEEVKWVPAVNVNLVFVVAIVALRLMSRVLRRRRAH
jgi:uncharacterized spore protein YtfJ